MKIVKSQHQEDKLQVTKEWLGEKSACSEGVRWFSKQKETDGIKLVEKPPTPPPTPTTPPEKR